MGIITVDSLNYDEPLPISFSYLDLKLLTLSAVFYADLMLFAFVVRDANPVGTKRNGQEATLSAALKMPAW